MSTLLEQVNITFREVLENATLEIDLETSAQNIDNWDSLNHVMLIAAHYWVCAIMLLSRYHTSATREGGFACK